MPSTTDVSHDRHANYKNSLSMALDGVVKAQHSSIPMGAATIESLGNVVNQLSVILSEASKRDTEPLTQVAREDPRYAMGITACSNHYANNGLGESNSATPLNPIFLKDVRSRVSTCIE